MALSMSRPLVTAEGKDVIVRTVGLTKLFGSRKIIDRLNLSVYRGDIFGFLGPNGAGKTTTIRMLLGLIMPTDGHIDLFGEPLTLAHETSLPRVGSLIETPALYPYMTGRDNLRAVAYSLGGVSEQRLDEILQTIGLAQRQRDRVRTYSLGMKQRLGVGIALLNNPELLILDEPANGLDPAGIVEIRDLLRNLAVQGKTIFISSHVLSEIQQICKRVAIINQGKLITEGTVEELTRAGGQGRFIVYVEDAKSALNAIQAQTWGTTARLDPSNQAVITPSPDGRGRSLNSFLVEKGFIADSILYQESSLEEIFLQLTGATNGGVK
jgi:ABC-2 type transport system ATP-binding protein